MAGIAADLPYRAGSLPGAGLGERSRGWRPNENWRAATLSALFLASCLRRTTVSSLALFFGAGAIILAI